VESATLPLAGRVEQELAEQRDRLPLLGRGERDQSRCPLTNAAAVLTTDGV